MSSGDTWQRFLAARRLVETDFNHRSAAVGCAESGADFDTGKVEELVAPGLGAVLQAEEEQTEGGEDGDGTDEAGGVEQHVAIKGRADFPLRRDPPYQLGERRPENQPGDGRPTP